MPQGAGQPPMAYSMTPVSEVSTWRSSAAHMPNTTQVTTSVQSHGRCPRPRKSVSSPARSGTTHDERGKVVFDHSSSYSPSSSASIVP